MTGRYGVAITIAALLAGCARDDTTPPAAAAAPAGPPPAAPVAWRPVIGDYVHAADTLSILEDRGTLVFLHWNGDRVPVTLVEGRGVLVAPGGAAIGFERGPDGTAEELIVGRDTARRLLTGLDEGGTFRIEPQRPVDELRREALAATPPEEEGDFLPSDLVELVTLDSTVKLDIRYAGDNNFMGTPFYSAPRAFLQRPAAEALVRANTWLAARGYGLLIHDGYRPWYVTKMFWDATPESLRVFVANPADGSRHNRGAAVDLTLYDRATGQPVEMTGAYDEMSLRSYPDYPGGTSRQRWLRALLRRAMEDQGFTVYAAEWWHFDFKDWRRYRIGNERLAVAPATP